MTRHSLMIIRPSAWLHPQARRVRPFAVMLAAVTVGLAPAPLAAQVPLTRRLDRLLDQPPFNRATWGVVLVDSAGRVLFERNGDRLFIPASNAKLLVSTTAWSLLGPDYRVTTSIYGAGALADGVLNGDLVIYGRGDPTFSQRCYGTDSLSPGACDSLWVRIDGLADSLVARGVQQIGRASCRKECRSRWSPYH